MLKVDPHPDYPPEEGRYLRGNDRSPVVVVVILNHAEDKIPPEIERLVRVGVETGAALSGTVQTENIGFEKIICNVIANPNIRWAVLTGPESEGHLTGEAFKALLTNGVDEKKRIIGTDAPHPLLFNLPMEFIERFRGLHFVKTIVYLGRFQVMASVMNRYFQVTQFFLKVFLYPVLPDILEKDAGKMPHLDISFIFQTRPGQVFVHLVPRAVVFGQVMCRFR